MKNRNNLPVPYAAPHTDVTAARFEQARNEMHEILNAGAKGLKPLGLELLPIKREMLLVTGLTDDQTDLILDCCNLLFAAILEYEAAIWNSKYATDPLTLVSSRINAGRAEGVVNSLFHGPTFDLLLTAMDRAPIAFYAMSEASPQLKIIARCYRP